MKQTAITLLISFFFLTACESDPAELLIQAKNKINNSASIAYKQINFWPNPAGKVDTVLFTVSFRKNEKALGGYDFLGINKRGATVYIENDFKNVNHSDSTVEIYPKEREDRFIKENTFLTYSPLKFINYPSWEYTKDTTIQTQAYRTFRRVEMDTIMDGHDVFVENYIFINKASALLERYERVAYFNGDKTQTIRGFFSEYNIDNASGETLIYTLPENYTTKIFEEKWKSPLTKGQQAPNFEIKDIQGNQVSLKDLQGKKVLLNFSVINCGYCKKALEHFNREDYQISKEIAAFYINPMDKKSEVLDYASIISIPFPVIAEEKNMTDQYGVSVYPTFFLIDGEGKIEEIVYGYDKSFFERIKM